MRLGALLVLGGLVAAAMPLAAGESGDCEGDLIEVGLGDATPYGTFYYVVTGATPDQGYGYLESNGVEGLQRGGWIAKHGGLLSSVEVCWSEHPAGWDFWMY